MYKKTWTRECFVMEGEKHVIYTPTNAHTKNPTFVSVWDIQWHSRGVKAVWFTLETTVDMSFFTALLLSPLKGSQLISLMTDGGICGDNVLRCQRIGIKHTPI